MRRSQSFSVSLRLLAAAVGLCAVFQAPAVSAATLTVCASGCAFADFQAALDAAQPGDTILLRAGETFVGHFRLPVKNNPGGLPILIRSDAPDASLPAAGRRLVPHGHPGGNTDLPALPRLVGRGGTWRTTPVVQADPGARHYILRFLDIDGLAQSGWETLVEIGNNSWAQATLDSVPSDIVLDRVFIHGHPTKGQKRCLSLNGRNVEVRNSYITDCMNFGFDSQAIAGFNGPGPFEIVNNYLEATGENVMFGGADPKIEGLVPAGIEIRGNHFYKPLAWRDPILRTPGAPGASVASGGALGAGTYYFKVVAILEIAMDIAHSKPSAEQAVTVSSGGSAVRLTWDGVAGADRYRVYMGTSPGGQNRYIETAGGTTSLAYTGSGEVWHTPAGWGTHWNVKNLLELKSAERVVIDGNVFEHLWPASQKGYAIVLTPRNQDGAAPWTIVRDVTFTNNILRHVSGGFSILGEDDEMPSLRTGRITIRNNLIYDLSHDWGGESHFLVMTRSPYDVTIDHNSFFHDGMVVLVDDGEVPGFVFTNNVLPHNTYGIFGSSAGIGNGAIAMYFPDAVVRRNAFAGGPASMYPPDNFFPDPATFWAQFVDPSADDFRLTAGSAFRGAATDGRDLGVDFAQLNAAVSGAVTGESGSSGGGGDGGGGDDGGGGGDSGDPDPGVPSPFTATPVALPGAIEAENFDHGGSGVAYADTTSGNEGGEYRDTSVDIQTTTDTGGGYNIGWMAPGEWLKYSVHANSAGTYTIEFRVAAAGAGGTFHLEVNGADVSGPLVIPDTGGWQRWTTVTKSGIALPAGGQIWTFVVDSAGPGGVVGNLNRIRAAAGGGGSTPHGGTPAGAPGLIEAENFDEGGSGVAYGDATSGNAGGRYRSTSVDIEATSDTGGGYNVGWMAVGEWLRYTVDVAAAGTYTLEFRVAARTLGGTFHLEVNGSDVTGPMTIPDTGGWQAWTTIRKHGVTLPSGRQGWTFVIDGSGYDGVVGNLNHMRAVAEGSGTGGSTPFGGTAASLPGTIQAEDFDEGGEGVAYTDASPENRGGQYRATGVDIEGSADAGAGFNLGWISAGEWLNYAVQVDAAGTYDLELRVASSGPGGTVHVEVNGVDVTGPLRIPDTGGWQSWVTIRKAGVALTGGAQVWRLVMDTAGPGGAVGNVNYIRVTPGS